MKAWRRTSKQVRAQVPPLLPGPTGFVITQDDGEPYAVFGDWVWLLAPPGVWHLQHRIDGGAWVELDTIDGENLHYLDSIYDSGDNVQWRIRGETPAGTEATLWAESNTIVWSVP